FGLIICAVPYCRRLSIAGWLLRFPPGQPCFAIALAMFEEFGDHDVSNAVPSVDVLARQQLDQRRDLRERQVERGQGPLHRLAVRPHRDHAAAVGAEPETVDGRYGKLECRD